MPKQSLENASRDSVVEVISLAENPQNSAEQQVLRSVTRSEEEMPPCRRKVQENASDEQKFTVNVEKTNSDAQEKRIETTQQTYKLAAIAAKPSSAKKPVKSPLKMAQDKQTALEKLAE